jgi:hypothetical protein
MKIQVVPKSEEEEDILEEALRITRGDRNISYGPPTQDFERIAGMWTAMFGHLLKEGAKFDPKHVAHAMSCVKLSRMQWSNKRDHYADEGGYARCGWLCVQEEERKNNAKK